MSKSLRKFCLDSRSRLVFGFVTATFFLLCHGILGASHVLGHSGVPTDTSQSHQMPMEGDVSATMSHGADDGAENSVDGGASSQNGASGLMYAAVILSSAFGALLFFALSVRCILPLSLRVPKRTVHVSRITNVPCRGPTPARLQVFRL